MVWWEIVALVAGGIVAGLINVMAGGGSALTVPLLVLVGVPGNAANGTNRVGVLVSAIAAVGTFLRLGVRGLNNLTPILLPAVVGSLAGSWGVTKLSDAAFERLFAVMMILIMVLSVRKPQMKVGAKPWSWPHTASVFFLVGIYGGAIQAGVGLAIMVALSRAGYDLVTANNIKMIITIVVTSIALPVFIANGDVRWLPGVVLAVGLSIGSWLGAHAAVKGGERVVRAVMLVAVGVLAARLLGVYDWVGGLFA